MIASYYGYYIEDVEEERHLIDIAPLLDTFIDNATREQKLSFKKGDEHQYLFREGDRFYMYVLTRSNELIKAINEDDLQHTDLYQRLQNNEELGFASYIYFDDRHFFSYFSSFLAPRVRAFSDFINALLIKGTLTTNYLFGIEPFLTQSTRAEALNMDFIGKATIEIPQESTVGQQFKNFFFGDDDVTDLSSFKLEIKPTRCGNIRDGLGSLLEAIPEESTRKFILKTKDELADKAMDMYLCGNKIVHDEIKKGATQEMYNGVVNNIRGNGILLGKMAEFTRREDFSLDGIDQLSDSFRRRFNTPRE